MLPKFIRPLLGILIALMLIASHLTRFVAASVAMIGLSPLSNSMFAIGVNPLEAKTLISRYSVLSYETFRVGTWQLSISSNKFSRGLACRLHAKDHNAIYLNSAVGFRFPSNLDVVEAVYRIDRDPPRRFRDDLPDLIAQSVPVDRGPIGSASQGIVWIPYAAVVEAKAITIQPRPDKRPRVRHFDGLVKLHSLAIAHGCVPESSFVE